jgi:hypothetical protein
MALYVLPLMADLQERLPGLWPNGCARSCRSARGGRPFWAGNWYARAVLRDQANRPVVIDRNHSTWRRRSGL